MAPLNTGERLNDPRRPNYLGYPRNNPHGLADVAHLDVP